MYIKVNSPVTAKTGQDTVLSCESKAFPVANVTWTKAGRVISEDSQYSVSSVHSQSSNILINNLTIHNVSVFDVGIYVCSFSNYLGSVAGQIEVQIVDGMYFCSICLSVYLSIGLSICFSMYQFICLSVYLSIYLSVCLTVCMSASLSKLNKLN